MCFDSVLDAFLYYMGHGGFFYSYLETYTEHINISGVVSLWESHGRPVFYFDTVVIGVWFLDTSHWEEAWGCRGVVYTVRGNSYYGMGENLYSGLVVDIPLEMRSGREGFLDDLDFYAGHVEDGGFDVAMFALLYSVGAIVVGDTHKVRFNLGCGYGAADRGFVSWCYDEGSGVGGFEGSFVFDAVYNNDVCGGIYRYLWSMV